MLVPHARSIFPHRTPLLLLGSLILAPHVNSAPFANAALRGGYPLAAHAKQGELPPILRTRVKKGSSTLEGRALREGVLSLRGGGEASTHASDPKTVGALKDGRQPTQTLKKEDGEAGFAYYDVDGTLYDGTMAHTAWWFIVALPSRPQPQTLIPHPIDHEGYYLRHVSEPLIPKPEPPNPTPYTPHPIPHPKS